MKTLTVFSSAQRATGNSLEFSAEGYLGARFFIDVTAASGGAPSLVAQIQVKDELTGDWHNLSGAVSVALTAAGQTYLTVFPGITTSASNPVAVSSVIGGVFRVAATVVDTVTFSVSAVLLGQ